TSFNFEFSSWADSHGRTCRPLPRARAIRGYNPRRATRDRAADWNLHALPLIASGSTLRKFRSRPIERISLRGRGSKCFRLIPPQSHSRPAFARPNIANGSAGERSTSLTKTDLPLRGFKHLYLLAREHQASD